SCRTPEQREARTAAAVAERLDRHDDAPGARPTPISIDVLDAIRTVEIALLGLADRIAADVQRAPAARTRSAGPGDEIGFRLATAAVADAADKRRWRFTGTRTVPEAVIWL
ncbi:hypothetical protein, partial [Escherichia coli]|uniref:hypothetical protein n=1 Tax=Escherichia coli TaxID=562 RepID=UPI003BA002DE